MKRALWLAGLSDQQKKIRVAGRGWAAGSFEPFLGGVMAAILIVEDEAQVRVLSESYLQNQGHETSSAANPDEALAVLAAKEIDLLFTDIGLQGDLQAGLTLAQTAIERHPDLRVLYTTALAVTDGTKALFVDNSAFLPKPYTIDQLQTVLTVNFGIKPHPN